MRASLTTYFICGIVRVINKVKAGCFPTPYSPLPTPLPSNPVDSELPLITL